MSRLDSRKISFVLDFYFNQYKKDFLFLKKSLKKYSLKNNVDGNTKEKYKASVNYHNIFLVSI